jgi:hypothetical protein
MRFFLNGTDMGLAFSGASLVSVVQEFQLKASEQRLVEPGFCPALSIEEGEAVVINYGHRTFKYPPDSAFGWTAVKTAMLDLMFAQTSDDVDEVPEQEEETPADNDVAEESHHKELEPDVAQPPASSFHEPEPEPINKSQGKDVEGASGDGEDPSTLNQMPAADEESDVTGLDDQDLNGFESEDALAALGMRKLKASLEMRGLKAGYELVRLT